MRIEGGTREPLRVAALNPLPGGSQTHSPYYPTVALPCTPCTWPRVPPVPGPGAEPRKKIFGLYNAFLDKKTHTQTTYSTSFESPRRALHERGHTGVSCETRGQIGRWCGGTGRVDVRVRAAAHAGRAGRGTAGAHLGLGWSLDGQKPVQPARRSTAPGSSPARSSSAASQLPSERRPRALPPTGADSPLAV